jgi:hypothetical protein
MTRTLYIDTATTGRFLYREPHKDPRQPHMCRLAMLHTQGDDQDELWVHLVRPLPGWRFDFEAIAGHNITREDAMQRGTSIIDAMQSFHRLLRQSDEIVAFNWDFHHRALAKTAVDLGDTLVLPKSLKQADAMRAATPLMRKLVPGRTDYSWPKHAEALRYFGAGAELPPIDIDPVERGRAMVESVRTIHQGIRARLVTT